MSARKSEPPVTPAEEFGFKSDHYYTYKEICERLDVDRSTVSRWVTEGRVKALQIGPKNIRIKGSDLVPLFKPIGKKALQDAGLL